MISRAVHAVIALVTFGLVLVLVVQPEVAPATWAVVACVVLLIAHNVVQVISPGPYRSPRRGRR